MLDFRPAPPTRLAGAAVDAVGLLGGASLADRVDVVAQGAAAGVDGVAKGAFDRTAQTPGFVRGDIAAALQRVQAGGEEGFVDVDVAQAGDEGLVEQGALERASRLSEAKTQVAAGKGQGFGAEVVVDAVKVGADPVQAAKAARVAEPKLLVAEGEDRVRVLGYRLFLGNHDQLPGHAEVNEEHLVAAEVEDNPYGPAANINDSPPRQVPTKPAWRRVVVPMQLHATNLTPDNDRAQRSDDGFDFG